ncbi:MAG: hypothetical protein Q4A74_06685 [Cardiobacteriaceae bacterium]|nr:hypothetical protein [Cardiobacteriaceae bacterium]
MQHSFLAVWKSKYKIIFLIFFTLLLGEKTIAQYATGQEEAIRPSSPVAETVREKVETKENTTATTVTTKDESEKDNTAEIIKNSDNLEAYTAEKIVEQAQAEVAIKEQAEKEITQESEDANTLPIEKLSPPQPQMETIIVERAIYRCAQGNKNVYVDADAKKHHSRCTLFRAEKTAEVPVDTNDKPKSSNINSCSGTLNYKGSTYLFQDNQSCPIPDSIFKNLVPAATNR